MAQIVLGLGTSHSPQLSTPPEIWPQHEERDQHNPDLRAADGRVYTYDMQEDWAQLPEGWAMSER